jgi:TonB-linked SusC/RagA family outer membrane protein
MKYKQQMIASAKLVMKITIVQIFTAMIFVCALYAKEAKSQNALEKKITLVVKNESLRDVIETIKSQTKANVSFSENTIDADIAITCSVKNKKLVDFLDHELGNYNIGYKVISDIIVLYQVDKSKLKDEKQLIDIRSSNANFVDIVINGYVYDDTGLPLPGATLKEKGTTNATSTDAKGFFTMKVKDNNAVLIVSSVGLKSQEVTLGKQRNFKITMVTNSTSLEDVVVVGYSTQKRINVTGAISSITTKDLTQSPVANISNSLVGRLPGLFASQAGGEPGNDGSTIRIRGVGTYTGNTSPLILVDGIEVTNFDNIDPNEVANLTILKDASSTAVYGIRGANGVIIITTRRGKVGPPKVSYTFNQAINSFTELPHSVNSVDYANGFNQALLADSYITGATYVPKYTDQDIALFQNGTDPVFHSNTDWRSLLFKKTSLQNSHNITISGGQKAVKYFISAGIFNQSGLFANTDQITSDFSPQSTYLRYNFRSNFNFEVTKRLKIVLDVSTQTANLSGNNQNSTTNNLSTGRVIADILRTAPTEGPGVIDGKLVILSATGNNPYVSLLDAGGGSGLRRQYDNTLNGTVRVEHDLDFITRGFKVHADVAVTTFNSNVILNTKALNVYTAVPLATGGYNLVPNIPTLTPEFRFTGINNDTRRVTGEFGFDYDRSFGGHTVTGLLLYNQQKSYDPSLLFQIPKGYQSYVGRVTYSFKSRYLAEFDAGYEGTENFAPGKRFGFFPAYSVGWIPSEESFFPKSKVVNYLKFRASYGQVGNDNIGGARFLYTPTSYTYKNNYYYFGNYGTNYSPVTGDVQGKAGNPDITWERANKLDIGTDIYLFNQKVKITADYFHEDRNNILSTPNTISAVAGLIEPAVNFGRMINSGVDGEISYNSNLGNFNYRIGGNFSFAHNKIVFQDEIPNLWAYQNRTGQRFGQYYGIPVAGIYKTWEQVNDANRTVYASSNNKVQPGDFIYRDVNGDGLINSLDAVPVGYSNIPEITYGITLGGSYKGFDFSVLFQGVGNVSLGYNGYTTSIGYGGAPPAGGPDYLTQAYTPQRYAAGLPINFPRYTVASNPNTLGGDFFVADARYLRLKNVETGYTFKAAVLKKIGIASARIYASSNNLITWAKVLPGVDPENAPNSNTNFVNYPLVRTINLGLNVNF